MTDTFSCHVQCTEEMADPTNLYCLDQPLVSKGSSINFRGTTQMIKDLQNQVLYEYH